MKTRVISGLAGIGILLLALTQFHTWIANLIVYLLYSIAVFEIHNAFKEKNVTATAVLLEIIGFIMIIVPLFYSMESYMPVTAITATGFAFIVVFNFDNIDFKTVASEIAFGLYVLIGFYSILRFKMLLPYATFGWDGAFLFIVVCAIGWGGDVFAYFAGYFFGKKKLAPTLSPKKTKEGAVGGVMGSVAITWIIMWIYSIIKPLLEASTAEYHFTAHQMLFVGLVAAAGSVVGIVGDLFASAVKRQVGIKDYGNIMPGHGGVMDRFDSVLLVAPIVSSFIGFIITAGGVFNV